MAKLSRLRALASLWMVVATALETNTRAQIVSPSPRVVQITGAPTPSFPIAAAASSALLARSTPALGGLSASPSVVPSVSPSVVQTSPFTAQEDTQGMLDGTYQVATKPGPLAPPAIASVKQAVRYYMYKNERVRDGNDMCEMDF